VCFFISFIYFLFKKMFLGIAEQTCEESYLQAGHTRIYSIKPCDACRDDRDDAPAYGLCPGTPAPALRTMANKQWPPPPEPT
jgi:hypothetical protein